MTPSRAQAIIKAATFGNYSKHMTPAEIDEVRAVWNTLPGWSSFYTALCMLAHPRPPRIIRTHSELVAARVREAMS